MARYVALLRAINVGSHIVKMEQLRAIFESLKFKNVQTFIASGNVIFETRATDSAALERKIETTLEKTLGYKVATFIRSPEQMIRVADAHPFLDHPDARESALYVTFLREEPEESCCRRLRDYGNETDSFAVQGSEAYWLCRTKMSESKFTGATLEKTLQLPGTARNITTVRNIAEKFCR